LSQNEFLLDEIIYIQILSLMRVFIRVITLVCFFLSLSLWSIDREKQSQIFWPLKEKHPISGSFAEFRNSHMHMGCDFKTFGINGFPVLGVFDGSVTTLSYSEYGYGLSVILTARRLGVNARYAHLNDLTGEVTGLETFKHALRLMGNKEGFVLKIRPELFPIQAGSQLARSGETGSGVSHLHLEIMDSTGYINPLMLPQYQIKDITPPTMQTLYIDSDKFPVLSFQLKEIAHGKYQIDSTETLKLSGRLRFKVGGYDFMTSRNRNNVYSLRLRINDKTEYQKTLDRMSYKEAGNRDILYDVNKSSLSPPVYVYNFFDAVKDKFSIDLKDFPDSSLVNISLSMLDASGNESILQIPIQVQSQIASPPNKHGNIFKSNDGVVQLDFSKAKVIGTGYVSIDKLNEVPGKFKSPEFFAVSEAYEVKANNYSWKGSAKGIFRVGFPEKENSLYLFDTSSGRWIGLGPSKQGNQFSFSLSRMGILVVMKDLSKPVINFPYLVNRDYNLPELKDSRMIERFYAIYDKGSGIAKMTVLFEGSPYPFEYDRDRGFIKLEVPKSFSKYKKNFFIQIELMDKAGNQSDWFTDILTLD
jgi:hypothetical protein